MSETHDPRTDTCASINDFVGHFDLVPLSEIIDEEILIDWGRIPDGVSGEHEYLGWDGETYPDRRAAFERSVDSIVGKKNPSGRNGKTWRKELLNGVLKFELGPMSKDVIALIEGIPQNPMFGNSDDVRAGIFVVAKPQFGDEPLAKLFNIKTEKAVETRRSIILEDVVNLLKWVRGAGTKNVPKYSICFGGEVVDAGEFYELIHRQAKDEKFLLHAYLVMDLRKSS